MRIVDLFSGAGGLTFGFYYSLQGNKFVETNHEFVFANEYDKKAAEAFHKNYDKIPMKNCKIEDLKDEMVLELVGNKPVDLIIGGPPCQSFSTVGKRCFDDKAKLYTEYLRMLKLIRPKMFLFENVKGMLSMREQIPVKDKNGNVKVDETGKEITTPGELVIKKIEDEIKDIEGVVGYTIVGKDVLNAKNFGVPQSRERVFLIGVRNDLIGDITWEYPAATHGVDGGLDCLTLRQAIEDLPKIQAGAPEIKEYGQHATHNYQKLMRKGSKGLTHHYCGAHNEKLTKIIEKVIPGEGRPYINKLVEEGELPQECYLTSGYNNTYGRLVADHPSTTITNNMCTPSALRCIHYEQNRTLTPREGARIQSFPDWYEFVGQRGNVTKQIGNAVPPLLAMAMARKIEEVLGDEI